MRIKKKNKSVKIILALLLILCVTTYCNKPPEKVAEELPEAVSETVTLTISPTLPGDLPSGNATQEELAKFAWNEFFALNWASSWTTDNKRDSPDASWTFDKPTPDLAVWETYIHRSELRPSSAPLTDRSTGKPTYDYQTSIDANGITSSNFWNNLDEDNEIGSAYLLAYDSLEVLYMAKTNLAEYNYLKTNLPDNAKLKQAAANGKSLTYLKNRSAMKTYCDSDTATNSICLPCGKTGGVQGAIEIKTAWRFLDPSKDDASRFIQKDVLYYTEESGSLKAQTGKMALIGMHIIAKTENYPTFVFASFEQIDVRKKFLPTGKQDSTAIMNYYGFKSNSNDPQKNTPVVPRAISSTIQSVNASALDLINQTNTAGTSLLQYYRLIGVQGKPVDYSDKDSDPNYFMANYVIESDSALTLFHGSFAEPFNGEANVVTNGTTVNMGGCQGCHGQAQLSGHDFSFILAAGAGKPFKEPDVLQSVEDVRKAVGDDQSLAKLKSFIEMYSSVKK